MKRKKPQTKGHIQEKIITHKQLKRYKLQTIYFATSYLCTLSKFYWCHIPCILWTEASFDPFVHVLSTQFDFSARKIQHEKITTLSCLSDQAMLSTQHSVKHESNNPSIQSSMLWLHIGHFLQNAWNSHKELQGLSKHKLQIPQTIQITLWWHSNFMYCTFCKTSLHKR